MCFKRFFFLILEEKELKQLCLKKNAFLLQLFLTLYTPKHPMEMVLRVPGESLGVN